MQRCWEGVEGGLCAAYGGGSKDGVVIERQTTCTRSEDGQGETPRGAKRDGISLEQEHTLAERQNGCSKEPFTIRKAYAYSVF